MKVGAARVKVQQHDRGIPRKFDRFKDYENAILVLPGALCALPPLLTEVGAAIPKALVFSLEPPPHVLNRLNNSAPFFKVPDF